MPDRVGSTAALTCPTYYRVTPQLRFILATIVIDAIGFGIVLPVLPQLVMTVSHAGLSEATLIGGWLGLSYAAMQFLFGPLVGNLGDRFGRRPVLLGALAGLTLDYLLLGFAPSLAWLFAGRLIAGLCGASWGPASAAIADIAPPEDRARLFGLVGAAFGIGFIIGPAIGGLLGELNPRAPFWVAAGLAGANCIYGYFFFPETLAAANRRPFTLARANPFGALMALRRLPGVLGLTGVYFVWAIASMVYPSTWSFYALAAFDWSVGTIGASLAWVGILMALMQVFVLRHVLARLGEDGALKFGLVVAILVFAAFAVVRDGRLAFVVLTLSALHATVQPSIMALMSRRVPADAQGELQGFTGSVAALAAMLAPMLLSWPLAYFTSPRAPVYFPGAGFAVASFAAVVALASLVALRRQPSRLSS